MLNCRRRGWAASAPPARWHGEGVACGGRIRALRGGATSSAHGCGHRAGQRSSPLAALVGRRRARGPPTPPQVGSSERASAVDEDRQTVAGRTRCALWRWVARGRYKGRCSSARTSWCTRRGTASTRSGNELLSEAGSDRFRTYIPERKQNHRRHWRDRGRETAVAVYQNRARIKRKKSKVSNVVMASCSVARSLTSARQVRIGGRACEGVRTSPRATSSRSRRSTSRGSCASSSGGAPRGGVLQDIHATLSSKASSFRWALPPVCSTGC